MRDKSGPPPACAHGIGKLAVSIEQLKAIQMRREVLVGDRDPCKRLYVDPLQPVRSDWPMKIAAAIQGCRSRLRQGIAGRF